MDRREFIGGCGAAVALSCTPSSPRSRTDSTAGSTENGAIPNLRTQKPAPLCQQAAHQTAGPFYVEDKIFRSRIAEGQAGRPLRLRFGIVDSKRCRPLSGIVIAIFHANADGVYSGFDEQGIGRDRDTRGATWLRGAQRSDNNGELEFETIYPGWYTGRSTHLHVTAHRKNKLVLSSQIYFPDDIVRGVYEVAPYHGWRDTEDADDPVQQRAVRGVLPRLRIEPGTVTDLGRLTLAIPG